MSFNTEQGKLRTADYAQAIEGVGINWSFAESEADADGASSLAVRVCACLVSIGGMLVTALMLGIVSGKRWLPCNVSHPRGGLSAL